MFFPPTKLLRMRILTRSSPQPIPARIQKIKEVYNETPKPTKDIKRQLLDDLVKIMTDPNVTNKEIMECIRFLNEKEIWL